MSSEAAEVERKSKGIMPLLLVGVVMLVLGAAIGAKVIGPMVVAGGENSAAAHEETGASSGGHGETSTEHGSQAMLHSIENLVVNPAGTQGTRFLILTLALEPDNAQTRDRLIAADAAIRDTLLQVLAAKTIQELSDPTMREAMREEMRAAAEALIKPGRIRKLFLPQFVLQ